jgi:hypothetical protein
VIVVDGSIWINFFNGALRVKRLRAITDANDGAENDVFRPLD